MKKIIISIVLLSLQLFANYAFDGKNYGKIDMHGGKGEKLTDHNKRFINMNNFQGLQGMSIQNNEKQKDIKKDLKKEIFQEK